MSAENARTGDIAAAGDSYPADVLCVATVGYLRFSTQDEELDAAAVASALLLQQFIDPIRPGGI